MKTYYLICCVEGDSKEKENRVFKKIIENVYNINVKTTSIDI